MNAIQIDDLTGAFIGVTGLTMGVSGVDVRVNNTTTLARLDWDSLSLSSGLTLMVTMAMMLLRHSRSSRKGQHQEYCQHQRH